MAILCAGNLTDSCYILPILLGVPRGIFSNFGGAKKVCHHIVVWRIAFVKTVDIVKPLRILVADDHQLFRHGVRALLQSHAGWEICGEASTGVEAVAMAKELLPDIVILDISMPDLNGTDAARRIRMASKTTEILILSLHYSDQLIREIVDSGALGYVLKSDSDRDLLIAVEALSRHKPYFTPHATEVILGEFQGGWTRQGGFGVGQRTPLFTRTGNRSTGCGGQK